MKVHLLDTDANRFQNLVLAAEEEWDQLFDWFDGRPIGVSWQPIEVEVLRDEEHRDRPSSDFPSLSPEIPVFSERAVSALHSMLAESGELLPLTCADGTYLALNVTRIIDALDEERSELRRFEDGGIMRVVRYELRPEALIGATIFKLPQLARSDVFVTDEFVTAIDRNRLTGFSFPLVWSDAS